MAQESGVLPLPPVASGVVSRGVRVAVPRSLYMSRERVRWMYPGRGVFKIWIRPDDEAKIVSSTNDEGRNAGGSTDRTVSRQIIMLLHGSPRRVMPVSARGATAKPSAALAAHAELKAMQQQRMDPRKLISALGAETMAVEDAMNSTELETLVEPMRAAVERRVAAEKAAEAKAARLAALRAEVDAETEATRLEVDRLSSLRARLVEADSVEPAQVEEEANERRALDALESMEAQAVTEDVVEDEEDEQQRRQQHGWQRRQQGWQQQQQQQRQQEGSVETMAASRALESPAFVEEVVAEDEGLLLEDEAMNLALAAADESIGGEDDPVGVESIADGGVIDEAMSITTGVDAGAVTVEGEEGTAAASVQMEQSGCGGADAAAEEDASETRHVTDGAESSLLVTDGVESAAEWLRYATSLLHQSVTDSATVLAAVALADFTAAAAVELSVRSEERLEVLHVTARRECAKLPSGWRVVQREKRNGDEEDGHGGGGGMVKGLVPASYLRLLPFDARVRAASDDGGLSLRVDDVVHVLTHAEAPTGMWRVERKQERGRGGSGAVPESILEPLTQDDERAEAAADHEDVVAEEEEETPGGARGNAAAAGQGKSSTGDVRRRWIVDSSSAAAKAEAHRRRERASAERAAAEKAAADSFMRSLERQSQEKAERSTATDSSRAAPGGARGGRGTLFTSRRS